jgi:hypothetical protein
LFNECFTKTIQRDENFFSLLSILFFIGLPTVKAQETISAKLPIYGSFSVGYGNTFFYGTLAEKKP